MELTTKENLPTGCAITLKEITDLLEVQHSKAMSTVTKMAETLSFGTVAQMDTVYNTKGQTIPTLALSKRQAIAVGGKLNTALLMKLIDRLEELEGKAKPLSPLEQISNALLLANEEMKKATVREQKALKMLEVAKTIEINQHSTDKDISVGEFCKVVSDKLDGVMLGRTNAYILLRALKLVESKSSRPTQYGLSIYCTYRKHDYGYSTRIYADKADQLLKLMIKHLSSNEELNDMLGHPLGDL